MIGLAAEATYRLVEMPLRNYGRGLSIQVSRRSAAQPVWREALQVAGDEPGRSADAVDRGGACGAGVGLRL